MSEQTGLESIVSENRQEWFLMLVCYMKMKTFSMWLHYYPNTTYESFNLIWPTLLDQMLGTATEAACKKLREDNTMCVN